jgi:hypothetical protein
MENDDTVSGGESLSIEQAASAFVKATSEEAPKAKPDEEVEQGEEADDELQASSEDEGESEGEDDPEGQADDEDDQEPESDHGRFVASNGKVRLPDGSVSTVSDLIAGNMKERDYRQKTMELAPQRRALEEQSSSVKALEQQVNEQREYLSGLLESLTPQPPDPNLQLDPTADPVGYLSYMKEKDQYDRFVQHANYIQQQMGMTRQQAELETQKKRQEKANEEWGILQEKLPAVRDQAKLKALADDIQSAGQAAGYSRQELAEAVPYDHRMSIVLQKAAKWDRLQASKPKVTEKVQGRPPVQRSGKQLSSDTKRAQRATDAVSRLKETGTVEDAARAYLASRKG